MLEKFFSGARNQTRLLAVFIVEGRFSKRSTGEGGRQRLTDEELARLYEARSEEAVTATQEKYGAYCRAIAQNLLSSREDVEECLGDVWLKAWNTLPPPACFKGWLGVVTRNQALTMLRAGKRLPPQAEDAAAELARALTGGPEEEVEARALGSAISDFLRSQPEPSRTVFLRRYWYGDTVEAAAERMGWSVSRTKSALFRVRRKLKDYLEKEDLYHG